MLLAVGGSCAVRPLQSTRPAARSRSQRGARRAAAYPADSNPAAPASTAALRQALAELRELLNAPRLNRPLALKQLQLVEARAEIVAVAVEAQKHVALAAAEQDAALLSADAALVAVVAQKDLATMHFEMRARAFDAAALLCFVAPAGTLTIPPGGRF